MTTREELLTALTGSVIDDGLYVAEVTPQQAEEIAALVWPFLAEAWDQGVIYGHNTEGRLIDKREANPYTPKDAEEPEPYDGIMWGDG